MFKRVPSKSSITAETGVSAIWASPLKLFIENPNVCAWERERENGLRIEDWEWGRRDFKDNYEGLIPRGNWIDWFGSVRSHKVGEFSNLGFNLREREREREERFPALFLWIIYPYKLARYYSQHILNRYSPIDIFWTFFFLRLNFLAKRIRLLLLLWEKNRIFFILMGALRKKV